MQQLVHGSGRGVSQAVRATVVGLFTALAVVIATASASGAPVDVPFDPGPIQPDHLGAAAYQKQHPSVTPSGVNDFGCRPDTERPRPVVLAHGTDSSAYSDWSAIGPSLVAAGFCVFAPNYGGAPGADTYGTEDLRASAWQIGEFVDRVLAETGAQQ